MRGIRPSNDLSTEILRVLELPRVHAQVAVRRLEQGLELVEREAIVDGQLMMPSRRRSWISRSRP